MALGNTAPSAAEQWRIPRKRLDYKDVHMALPSQVIAAGERSNALIAQIAEKQNAGNTPGIEAPTVPPPAPAPAANTEGGPDHQQQPVADDPLRWRPMYLTLRGKYDAEVPRMAAEIRDLKERNKALDERVTSLTSELQAAKQASPASAATPALPDDMEGRFDPELVAFIRSQAQSSAQEAVRPMQQVVEETRSEREAREQQERDADRRDQFIAALDDIVPDWRALDKEPGLQTFLAQQDPATGVLLREVLATAAQAFDVVNVARLFNRYRATRAPAPPPAPSLGAQVVPGPAGSVPGFVPGGHGEKRMWRQSEIRAFYKTVANRTADPATIQSTQQDIESAQREGRILAG